MAHDFCTLEQSKTLKLQDSQAWKDLQMMIHGKHRLIDWLQAYFSKNPTSTIYDSAKPELAMVMMEELPNNANDLAFESRVRRFIHYTRLRFLLSNNTSQSMPSMQQSKKEDGRSQNTREHHIHPNNSSNFLLWKNTVSDVCQDISWLLTMPCCESMLLRRQHYFGHQTCGEIYGKS